MDQQVEVALDMLEDALETGDEEFIREQVSEIRSTGIFSPEMNAHLDAHDNPADQLRAIINSIRLEELSKQGVTPEQMVAMQILNEMPYDEQLNMLEKALGMGEEPNKELKAKKTIKSGNNVVRNILKNIIVFGVIIAIGYLISNIGR